MRHIACNSYCFPQVGNQLQSSSEDDDADFRDIPFPQDTAMQQVSTTAANCVIYSLQTCYAQLLYLSLTFRY